MARSDHARRDFADAVRAGLSAPKKAIPARFFYDQRGSELFDAITTLPEYYPTRVETAILTEQAARLCDAIGADAAVVEFGAGSATKTPLLLRAIAPRQYVGVDISGEHLNTAAGRLRAAFPSLRIDAIVGDFTKGVALPPLDGRPLGFFPGSTIGNFAPAAAVDLLRAFRATLGAEARLLIGIDRRKDRAVLEAAYDDAAGVTAEFNRNLLARINRELAGDIPLDAFVHRAVWNDDSGRIEMHLEATRDVAFTVDGQRHAMRAGETIHTENSYKLDAREAAWLARASGWEPRLALTDADDLFGLYLWDAAMPAAAP